MRTLIVSSIFVTAFLVAGASSWQANAAVIKGASPAVAAQTEPVRCYLHAPVDGCGWGWYRGRGGRCRPC